MNRDSVHSKFGLQAVFQWTLYLLLFLSFFQVNHNVDSIYSLYTAIYEPFHFHPHHLIQYLPFKIIAYAAKIFGPNRSIASFILSELVMLSLLAIDFILIRKLLRLIYKDKLTGFAMTAASFFVAFSALHLTTLLQFESYGFVFPLILLLFIAMYHFIMRIDNRFFLSHALCVIPLIITLFHQNGIIAWAIVFSFASLRLIINKQAKECMKFIGINAFYSLVLGICYYAAFLYSSRGITDQKFLDWFLQYARLFSAQEHGALKHLFSLHTWRYMIVNLIAGNFSFSQLPCWYFFEEKWKISLAVFLYGAILIAFGIRKLRTIADPKSLFVLFLACFHLTFMLATLWWHPSLHKWYIFSSIPLLIGCVGLLTKIPLKWNKVHYITCLLLTCLCLQGVSKYSFTRNQSFLTWLTFSAYATDHDTENKYLMILTDRQRAALFSIPQANIIESEIKTPIESQSIIIFPDYLSSPDNFIISDFQTYINKQLSHLLAGKTWQISNVPFSENTSFQWLSRGKHTPEEIIHTCMEIRSKQLKNPVQSW